MDKAGGRFVAIWVGIYDGEQIAVGLRNFPTPRPPTYSFVEKILEATGATVLDARLSDALSLAVRVGCPIYVNEEIFEKAGVPLSSLEEKFGPHIRGIDILLSELEIKFQHHTGKLKADKPEAYINLLLFYIRLTDCRRGATAPD